MGQHLRAMVQQSWLTKWLCRLAAMNLPLCLHSSFIRATRGILVQPTTRTPMRTCKPCNFTILRHISPWPDLDAHPVLPKRKQPQLTASRSASSIHLHAEPPTASSVSLDNRANTGTRLQMFKNIPVGLAAQAEGVVLVSLRSFAVRVSNVRVCAQERSCKNTCQGTLLW